MAISLRSDASGTFGAIALDGVDRIKVDTSGNVTFLGQTIYTTGFNSTPIGQGTGGAAAGTFTALASTGNTTIGTNSSNTITLNGKISSDLKIKDAGVDVATTSVTTTNQLSVFSYAAATYRTAKILVQIVDSTNSAYHSAEFILIHNGTTVNLVQYGVVATGSELGTFDAAISGGNVQLLFTATAATTKTVKAVATMLTV